MIKLSSLFLRFIALILGLEDNQNFPPPLSKDQEEVLFQKMHNGDLEARSKIIEHNLRLVSHLIKKYYYNYDNPDELLSIGSYGLIKAVDSFKSGYGTRFATYGAKCIQNEILMYFRSQKKLSLEVSINDTIDIDKDGNPLTYLDIIGVDDSIVDNVEMQIFIDKIRDLVDNILEERERQIVVLRYGLKGYKPLTQREVAKHLLISRSYVSRIEKKALQKLKDAFGDARPDFND